MAGSIDFYFDFASPYAFLASLRIGSLAAKHDRTVFWRPILLGAVFKVSGSSPNMSIPLRGDYLRRDMLRCARLQGVPMRIPAVMPLHSLAPARAFYWLEQHQSDLAIPFARTVFADHWLDGGNPGTEEAVGRLASGMGLDPQAILEGCRDQAIKDRLRAVTDEAIARGVFGAPFIFVDDEPFWGADRLGDVDRWLETGGW